MTEMTVAQIVQLALQLHQAGRLQEAEVLYRQVLAQEPNNACALDLLGVLAHQKGLLQEATDLIQQAIRVNPSVAQFHNNLGVVFGDGGRSEEAIAAFRQAVRISPDYARAYCNLGNALLVKDRVDEALAVLRKAVELKPDYAQALHLLGLGLRKKGRIEEAISAYRQAVRLKEDFAEAYNSLGMALREAFRFSEAIAALGKAVEIKPDFADAHWNKALLLLLTGRFAEGWAENEWRWRVREMPSTRPNFPQPQWSGGDPSGSTILLHTEQGVGDTFQFIRYAPLLGRRGARVIVACQPQVKSLLQNLEGVHQVLAGGEPLPPFDMYCPLMSLPLAFGTTLQTVPANVPYLRPKPALANLWRSRLAPRSTLHAPRLKVGLAWAGNPRNRTDPFRSIPRSVLAPLAEVPGVQLYSLQKGEAAGQAKDLPKGIRLIDWTDELKDFADTAALMANLDLVVTVETAVAHLAGALARPVWTLLPFMPDWRWLLEREDSPWYPTMRLFRQKTSGDWAGVIERVAGELNRRVQGSGFRAQ